MIRVLTVLIGVAAFSAAALAGEPDWFTRVKEKGLKAASEEDVALHEQGILRDSLHVGECYYHLGRWSEGVLVFRRLHSSPDRNYAAAAMARTGEGLYHLGKPEEAREVFSKCLEEHPEAWLDESIPERCRAWLAKLDGKIAAPAPPGEAKPDVEGLKREVKELTDRLAELKRLLLELTKEQ
ncbi:MAG: tetratricopeptide repeat protein [Planctomycetes bacterium]|jgi:tetratricopeptide (TPR) repeat protein|nr:tetratricopeptide repeat protein [Planctomycetota bacterium]